MHYYWLPLSHRHRSLLQLLPPTTMMTIRISDWEREPHTMAADRFHRSWAVQWRQCHCAWPACCSHHLHWTSKRWPDRRHSDQVSWCDSSILQRGNETNILQYRTIDVHKFEQRLSKTNPTCRTSARRHRIATCPASNSPTARSAPVLASDSCVLVLLCCGVLHASSEPLLMLLWSL